MLSIENKQGIIPNESWLIPSPTQRTVALNNVTQTIFPIVNLLSIDALWVPTMSGFHVRWTIYQIN